LAEHWVSCYVALPLVGTVSVAYSTGVSVEFAELAPVLGSLAAANARRRPEVLDLLESGALMRTALQVFQVVDDGSGYLTWQGGGIQDFVTAVFCQYHLSLPSSSQVAVIYEKFAAGRQQPRINTSECLCLVDALFRATFYEEAVSNSEAPEKRQDDAALMAEMTAVAATATATAVAAVVSAASASRSPSRSQASVASPPRVQNQQQQQRQQQQQEQQQQQNHSQASVDEQDSGDLE
ncbi:unnamed protein product, partial [Polarella glacialis]